MYVLPFYADKTFLSFDFLKCCLCGTNFCRLIALRRKKIHFLTKYRGLGNGYKVTIISATRVLGFKVEYRNQFCRNYKRAKVYRLRIGEKDEFNIMLGNPAFKEVASCLNSHRHFEIQSCLSWEYIPFFVYIQVAIRWSMCCQFEESSMRRIFLSLDHYTIILRNSP